MEATSIPDAPSLPGPAFVGLLTAADVSQAAFARLAGVSARQVNNWARGRAEVPRWAALLACVLQSTSVDSLGLTLEETAARAPDTGGPAASHAAAEGGPALPFARLSGSIRRHDQR